MPPPPMEAEVLAMKTKLANDARRAGDFVGALAAYTEILHERERREEIAEHPDTMAHQSATKLQVLLAEEEG